MNVRKRTGYLKRSIILVLAVIVLSGCSKSAGSYYKEGVNYFKGGNYIKAEENFIKAIEKNENKAEYYIDYGFTLIMLEEYDSAIRMFEKAYLDKDNAIVRKNNKMSLRGKGIAYYYGRDYIASIDAFEKALDIKDMPDLDLDILTYLSNALEKSALYEKALECLSKILNETSAKGDIYFKRAYIYSRLGKYKESIEDYNKAIELDNKNYNYYFGKYFALLADNKEDEAKEILNSMEGLAVNTADDKYNLAKVYYYLEDYERAKNQLEEVVSNGFTGGYYYIGSICEKQGDYEGAVHNYLLYLEDDDNEKTGAVYNQLGMGYFKLGNYEEGLRAITLGLQFKDITEEQSLRRNEIVGLEHLGKYDEALKKMKSYTSDYPNDTDAKREYEFIKTRVQ